MFGAFGNTANNATPAAGTSLFGATSNAQPQQPQQQTGSLFGNTQNQQQPSLFGATNTGNAPNLFVNTQAQPGGGLFGQNNAQTQNQGSGGGSLFGGQQAQQQQQQPGTSLFGSTNTNQPQQQQGTNLYGAPAQQTQPAAPGGLFGSKPAGSLFGQGGLSINTNTSQGNNTNSNSLFGSVGQSTQQQQQQQQQQPAANNIFGQPQQQGGQTSFGSNLGQSTIGNPTNSLFGGSNLGSSTLGNLGQSNLGASSLLSRAPSSTQQNQPDSAQAQFAKLTAQIEAIANAWNSSSPECRFQHYFYNFVDPNQVSLYGRPPNTANEALWQQAVRENPDPSCHVPVLAVGFDDLRQRVEAQAQKASEQQEQLKKLKTGLSNLTQRHSLSNSSRLLRAASSQTQIMHRLLTLIQHLHLLIPSLRSSAIRPEEEELRGKLEEIEEELKRGRGKGKINELWALVGAINAAKERATGGGSNSSGEWVVVDEEGLSQIAGVLSEQQAGLIHLTKILQKAIKDLNVIMGRGSSAADEVYEVDRDELWSSTSTLRASALR
ncbi:hypothetical protein PTI98_003624 [Pleurotus ostreatus]|nr:hypothetical protein PTI98_003624 [Pleurotus ostreatus]